MKAFLRQDAVAIGQLVVALLMLWSLRQTGKNLDYARAQIEGAKLPSIDVASFGNDEIYLLNSGGSETSQFQVIGLLGVHYEEKTEEVTRLSIAASSLKVTPVHERLLPGEEFAIPFVKLTFVSVDSPLEPGEQEAFAVVLRYYRSADRRPFYKILSFLRREIETETETEKRHIYFPLYVAPGSGLGGLNKPVLKKLRKALRDLCVDNFDIGSSDVIQ